MANEIKKVKNDLISEIDKRITDKIIEKTNADLLKKLIEQAETINEAIMIAELGTTYKRTGFHFDKRLEKMTDTIKYFKKNEKLSFVQNKKALTHKLIIGDNYDGLLNLLIEYHQKIDVIYIDPPYGKDSMGEFAKTNYENAITRDNLLSMLYPRLVLARQLLSDNGVIFCSIDDKNQAYVKGLFDEVFEESNFVGTLIWRKKEGGGQADAYFVTEHEYVIAYAKSENFKWLDEEIPVEEAEFNKEDENGKFTAVKLAKWGNTARREDRPKMYFPIKSPDGKNVHPIAPDGGDGRWRVGKKRMDILVEKNLIFWKKKGEKWIAYEKVYFSEGEVKKIKERSILFDIATTADGTNELTQIFGKKDIFGNPKPTELIKFFLQYGAKQDAVTLDFFAGSGTTAQAVLSLNNDDGGTRQYILVTNDENGIAQGITSKRLKRVMTGECYDGTKDFMWNKENKPLRDNLDVYDIATVAPYSDKPFTQIDETLYGQEKLGVKEKIKWVCENFEGTQKNLEDK
ncbi:site-specific DNA-methyltransferase [Patescibacteria group bacterium]|nr:site-specific DNA-methyltransferase [Patescibacteria group bacterium]